MKNYIGKEYYDVLGLDPSATADEIKSSYRRLARKYHPDLNAGNKLSEQKFKDITEAYDVLGSPEKRRKFDLINGYNIKPKQSNAPKQPSYQAKRDAKQAYSQQKKEEDKPKEFSSVFSEFMDGIFSTPKDKKQEETPPKQDAPKPVDGSDITVDVDVSAEEAHNGTVKQINVLYTDSCKKCRGRKFLNESCPSCNGDGEISTHSKLRVKIPPNVKEGSKIRVSEEGNRAQNGGKNGDLYLIIHVKKNSVLTYDGLNVLCTIPITPAEAAIGTSIEVPTKDGFITMKIPPSTTSGQKFKLAAEGLKDEKTNQVGDQVITVEIVMNKNLSDEEKELYKKLLDVQKVNPRGDILKK